MMTRRYFPVSTPGHDIQIVAIIQPASRMQDRKGKFDETPQIVLREHHQLVGSWPYRQVRTFFYGGHVR